MTDGEILLKLADFVKDDPSNMEAGMMKDEDLANCVLALSKWHGARAGMLQNRSVNDISLFSESPGGIELNSLQLFYKRRN